MQVAKKIMDAHGCPISCASDGKGRGSSFTIQIEASSIKSSQNITPTDNKNNIATDSTSNTTTSRLLLPSRQSSGGGLYSQCIRLFDYIFCNAYFSNVIISIKTIIHHKNFDNEPNPNTYSMTNTFKVHEYDNDTRQERFGTFGVKIKPISFVEAKDLVEDHVEGGSIIEGKQDDEILQISVIKRDSFSSFSSSSAPSYKIRNGRRRSHSRRKSLTTSTSTSPVITAVAARGSSWQEQQQQQHSNPKDLAINSNSIFASGSTSNNVAINGSSNTIVINDDYQSLPSLPSSTITSIRKKKPKVLIVEDMHMNRVMLARMLRDRCEYCVEAKDGIDAIEIVQRAMEDDRCFDIIVIDYQVSRMDGPAATAKLRELGFMGIIVGVTGNVLPTDIKNFEKHGADAVLTKPLRLAQFDHIMNTFNEKLSKSRTNSTKCNSGKEKRNSVKADSNVINFDI